MMLIFIPVCPLGSIGCPPVPSSTHSSLLNKCFCPHPFDVMLPHLRVVSVVVTDSSLISFLLERWWSKLPSTYFSHTMKVCLWYGTTVHLEPAYFMLDIFIGAPYLLLYCTNSFVTSDHLRWRLEMLSYKTPFFFSKQ